MNKYQRDGYPPVSSGAKPGDRLSGYAGGLANGSYSRSVRIPGCGTG